MNTRDEAYDFIKAWENPGEFAGWFDISIKPPINIHILVNIKDWGCAIGRLTEHGGLAFISKIMALLISK
jgi:hypothetical protein